jgi:hypothetical protein
MGIIMRGAWAWRGEELTVERGGMMRTGSNVEQTTASWSRNPGGSARDGESIRVMSFGSSIAKWSMVVDMEGS